MNEENPVNSIPPVVVALVIVITGIEAVLSLASNGFIGGQMGVGWRVNAIQDYGFSPAVMEYVTERGQFSFDLLKRFVTYAFVHVSFTQALFAVALLLALGKFVGELLNPVAVVLLFVVSAVSGALVYGLLGSGRAPLVGTYPAVYGFIGAYTYLTWLYLKAMGQNQLVAFRLIGILLGIQLVFGLIFGSDQTWIADLTGFFVGFGLCTLLAPGGWAAFLRRIRQRQV